VKAKANHKLYQQGDVLFKEIDPVKQPATKEITDGVIAKGDSTGHAHRIGVDAPVKLFCCDATMYLVALDTCLVEHEEHKSILLPPGTYMVYKVREYDHFTEEAREVVD